MSREDEVLDLLNGLVNLLNAKHQKKALDLFYNGDMLLNGFDLHVLVGDDGKKRLVMETMYGYSFTVALVGLSCRPPLVLFQSTDLTEYFLMLINDLSAAQFVLLEKLGSCLSRGEFSEDMITPRSLPSWPSKGVAKAYECLRVIRGVRNDPERVSQAIDTAVLTLEQLERGIFVDVPGDAGLPYRVPQWALDLLVATDDLARHLEWSKDKDDETKRIISKLKDIADEAYKAQVLDMSELSESPHYLYNKMMPYVSLCKLASNVLPDWLVITADSAGGLWANGMKPDTMGADHDLYYGAWIPEQKLVGRVSGIGLGYSSMPSGNLHFAEWETWQIRRSDWDLYQIKAGSFGDEKAVKPMPLPSESALTDKPVAIIDRMNALQETVNKLGRDLHEVSEAVERMTLGIDDPSVAVLVDLVATYDEFKAASFGDSLGNEHWDGRFTPIVERARALLLDGAGNTAVEDHPPYPEGSLKSIQAKLADDIEKFARDLARMSPSIADPRPGQWVWGVDIAGDGASDYTAVPIMDDSEALDNVTDDSGLPQIYDELDPRIAPVVMLLRQHDVHTISSCDGGDGHAFDRPTVVIRLPSTDQTNTAVFIMAYTYAVWEILDRFGYYGFEVFPSVNEDGRVQYLTVRFNYSGADGYAIPLHEPRRASLSHATKTASMRPTYWQAIVWARYQAETHGRLAPRLYMAFMPKVMDIALRCFEDGYFDGEEANNRLEKLIFG